MLVKELIQELQKFDPEQEMVFHCDIESGRSFSSCKEGDYGIEVEELDEEGIKELWIKDNYGDDWEDDWTWEEILEDGEDTEEEIKKFIKEYKPPVIFSISGEETDYE
jgi:hypothetical protein